MPDKIIEINKEEVQRCFQFALDFVDPGQKKSDLDFGNMRLPRGVVDRIADSALGKIGEIGFQKFCERNGLKIEIDFNIKEGKNDTDYGQDVSGVDIDGEKKSLLPLIDIKSTKSFGSWLLLENHKFWASIIVMMAVDVPLDIETNLQPFKNSLNCKFRGYAFFADFFDVNGNPWFEFQSGRRLVSPRAVKFIYENAVEKYNLILRKEQLLEFFPLCKETLGEKFFVGPPLKCPNQVGLISNLLRNSPEDIELLFNVIRSTSVPAKVISDAMLPAMIEWTTVLSRLDKSL